MNNEKQTPSVPYIVHEGAMARQERTIKRLYIIILVIFLAFVVTNVGWIIYENQLIDEITVSQENESGYNSFIGNDGDIVNGIIGYGEADDH